MRVNNERTRAMDAEQQMQPPNSDSSVIFLDSQFHFDQFLKRAWYEKLSKSSILILKAIN